MLTRFGKPAAPGDAVDLMVECHERIRSFLALARRIGEASDASDAEVREAAQRVHRYFTQALPLHAEDEERSIRPRLLGREPAVDAELSRMMQEHEEHGPPLSALLAACDALAADPGRLAELRRPLLAATGELERHFVLHLEREEKVIFPAMRRLLDKATDAIIVDEIRGRRGVGPLAEREGLHGADPARR
jgi:hemerythrin-like domain-containing protein